jgi:hypothetical protein
MKVYVVTCPENGWDCLCGVWANIRDWFKYNDMEEADYEKLEKQLETSGVYTGLEPYVIYKKEIN